MKLLRCKLCRGEVDIIGGEHSVIKKVKCTQCGYSNEGDSNRTMPEVVIIKKRPPPSP
jgi:hypothetical protein